MAKNRKSRRKGRSAAFMRSINPFLKAKRSRRSRSKIKSRRINKVARRKGRSKRYGSFSGGFLGISMREAGASMAYGAARQKMSNYIAPYTSFIPAGAITDEVGMILANALLARYVFKKEGVIRSALRTGIRIEFARIGEAAINGQIFPSMGGSASSSDAF